MKSSKLNPVTTHKEFNGISGALGITIGLPTLTVLFYLLCNQTYSIHGINVDFAKIKSQLPITQDELWQLVFDKTCWLAYLAWFFIGHFRLLVTWQVIKWSEIKRWHCFKL